MTNPLIPAIEVWLAIYENLPEPVKLLFTISLTLFGVLVFFNIIFKIRS